MSQGTVISLSSVNADFQVRVERRPDLSETLLAHDFVQLSGGKAANVAYLACRLGVSATLVAHVGADALREQALQPLREIGIDLQHVRSVTGKPTGVSMITVPPDGKKGIILAGNANNDWSQEDITTVRAAIAGAPSGSGNESMEGGIHLGAMAGTLHILQHHYLGLQIHNGIVHFNPSCPTHLNRLCVSLHLQCCDLQVEMVENYISVTAAPANRQSIKLVCQGEAAELQPGASITLIVRSSNYDRED